MIPSLESTCSFIQFKDCGTVVIASAPKVIIIRTVVVVRTLPTLNWWWATIGIMAALKWPAMSPPSEDGKKHKEEDCCKLVTDNVLECIWCKACLQASCAMLSEEVCILVGNVCSHIVFLCTPCLWALPTAFKYYDGFSNFDTRVSPIKKSSTKGKAQITK